MHAGDWYVSVYKYMYVYIIYMYIIHVTKTESGGKVVGI